MMVAALSLMELLFNSIKAMTKFLMAVMMHEWKMVFVSPVKLMIMILVMMIKMVMAIMIIVVMAMMVMVVMAVMTMLMVMAIIMIKMVESRSVQELSSLRLKILTKFANTTI